MTTGPKKRKSRQNPALREFILRNIAAHPEDIGALAGKEFKLSRTAVNRYLQRLISEGLVTASGQTNARRYELAQIVRFAEQVKITPGMYENDTWMNSVVPKMINVPQNVIDICQYGFTEMLNNVIDHSGSSEALITYDQTYTTIRLVITDTGVGVFEKIKKDFNLADPREALLELSKGKLTSDRTKHSGEGIFFTSRMFDVFSLISSNLYYQKRRLAEHEWLIETEDVAIEGLGTIGTSVRMEISTDANWTAKEVFDRYQDDDYRFSKTHVPIMLAKYGTEQLVSRSQAKRVLSRFEKFAEVILDFQGVNEIGRAFADEIFRVFHNQHPDIQLMAVNTTPDIDRMITHVRSSNPQTPNGT